MVMIRKWALLSALLLKLFVFPATVLAEPDWVDTMVSQEEIDHWTVLSDPSGSQASSIAMAYGNGFGFKRDPQKARIWLERAALQGDFIAHHLLFAMAFFNRDFIPSTVHDGGVSPLLELPGLYLEEIAKGNRDAYYPLCALGNFGFNDLETNKAVWQSCLKGAQLGIVDSQFRVALAYDSSDGFYDQAKVIANSQQFLETSLLPIGTVVAELDLRKHYYVGVKTDHDMALIWFKKAAAQGHKLACDYLNRKGHGLPSGCRLK